MSVNNDSEVKNKSNAEKLMEDATVPEESTVEGDTENWSTSPYPKGLNLISNRHLSLLIVFKLNVYFTRFVCSSQEPVSSAARSATKG